MKDDIVKYISTNNSEIATLFDELNNDDINIALACAHPAKFPDSIKDSINILPDQPKKLKDLLALEEKYRDLNNDVNVVKNYIIDNIKKL